MNCTHAMRRILDCKRLFYVLCGESYEPERAIEDDEFLDDFFSAAEAKGYTSTEANTALDELEAELLDESEDD